MTVLEFCFKEFRFGLHADSILLVDFLRVVGSIEDTFIIFILHLLQVKKLMSVRCLLSFIITVLLVCYIIIQKVNNFSIDYLSKVFLQT